MPDHPSDLSSQTADVRFDKVEKAFSGVVALHSLDLNIPRGCFFSLLGPSGCGKTTTLRLIAGFEQPTRGDIYIRERQVTGVPAHKRNFGMVFQSLALFPHLSVAQNVAFGLKMRKVDSRHIQAKVNAALELVALGGFGERYPNQLSGGQQQRVALARAIVFEPDVLLLDEPLSALDRLLREQMQVELRQLQKRLGTTTVFVTHDQEEALTMSDFIGVMSEGHLQQVGQPSDIYERPKTEFVATFLGASNIIPAEIQSTEGSTVLVAVAGTTAHVHRPEGWTGQSGTIMKVALRPEKMRVVADGGRAAARLKQIVYRGAQTHLYLDMAGVSVKVHMPNATIEPLLLEAGTTVRLDWHDDCMVPLG